MSGEHTPGPWVVLELGTAEPRQIAQAGTFASIAELRGLAPDSVQLANALVMAAAPALLEGLQRLEWSVDTFHRTGKDTMGCPACGNSRLIGLNGTHAPGCWLSALLTQATGAA